MLPMSLRFIYYAASSNPAVILIVFVKAGNIFALSIVEWWGLHFRDLLSFKVDLAKS